MIFLFFTYLYVDPIFHCPFFSFIFIIVFMYLYATITGNNSKKSFSDFPIVFNMNLYIYIGIRMRRERKSFVCTHNQTAEKREKDQQARKVVNEK